MRRPIVIVPLALVGLAVSAMTFVFIEAWVFNGTLLDDDGPSTGPCAPSDFRVEKISVSVEDGFANLTGSVISRCAQASGVELRWTVTRDDGTVAFSHTFWPDSISNIPPKSTYAFSYPWLAPSGHFTSKVEPHRTQAW
jgi:hypothetical protein